MITITYNKGTHIFMCITALFSIAKINIEPRCLPRDEWMKKMRYMDRVKYC